MNSIIFYHPYDFVKHPSKGSELRPKMMMQAFQNIGYNVDLVVGNSLKRKSAMEHVKAEIQKGKSYDFLYAESSNMPIPLTDDHHLPLRPIQDYRFFRLLNKHSIPTGFFYRDLYWRISELKKEVSYGKFIYKQLFHYLEYFGLKNTIDYLFLPTQSMVKYLPTHWSDKRVGSLYPGCELIPDEQGQNAKESATSLTLFYVGGTRPPYYDLTPLIKLVNQLADVELILCCRKKDWETDREYYQDLNFDNTTIIHADSSEIIKYYKKADIFLDIRKPQGYLTDTIPIKIIESIGHMVPLLLLKGTEAANLVRDEGAGWVVDSFEDAAELLQDLKTNQARVKKKRDCLLKIRERHTWEERAKKAGSVLSALKAGLQSR